MTDLADRIAEAASTEMSEEMFGFYDGQHFTIEGEKQLAFIIRRHQAERDAEVRDNIDQVLRDEEWQLGPGSISLLNDTLALLTKEAG